VQELRRRRTDQTIELRKARKDEQLTKRRNIDTDEIDNGRIGMSPLQEQKQTNGSAAPPQPVVNESNIKQIVSGMFT